MTLTHEDVQLLTQRFAAKEHEFYDGLAYVDEVAVSTRLDSVDPSWHFERIGEPVRTEEQCIVWVRLTVKGVSRDGVGMSKIWLKKKDGTIILNGEPEKSAATDALRRASRLFGIGRYLLQLPADVRDYNALAKWLGESTGNPQQTNRQQYQQQAQTASNVKYLDSEQRRNVNRSTGEISEDTTQFVSTKLIVKLTQKGKPFLIFPNVDEPNHYATDFSRERLRKAGYNVDGWDKPGEYPLEPAALVSGAIDDSGYLNVTDLVQDMPM